MIIRILLITLLVSVSLLAQKVVEKPVEPIDVNYCDLLKNLDKYSDKLIRVSAVYRSGFEWSELYCPSCEVKSRTWVEYGDFDQKSSKKFNKNFAKNGGSAKVTFIGKMLNGKGYGHMGAYANEFLVTKIEYIKVVSKSSSVFDSLPEKDKANISCSFESKNK